MPCGSLRVMQDLLRVAAAHLVAVRTAVQVFAAARSQVGAHLQPYVMGPIMTVCKPQGMLMRRNVGRTIVQLHASSCPLHVRHRKHSAW